MCINIDITIETLTINIAIEEDERYSLWCKQLQALGAPRLFTLITAI